MRRSAASLPYAYIRRTYGVEPVPGERIRHHVKGYGEGVILRVRNETQYVRVRFDSGLVGNCHPTEMDYLGAAP